MTASKLELLQAMNAQMGITVQKELKKKSLVLQELIELLQPHLVRHLE